MRVLLSGLVIALKKKASIAYMESNSDRFNRET